MNRIMRVFRTAETLGASPVLENLQYRLRLRSGEIRRKTPATEYAAQAAGSFHALPGPDRAKLVPFLEKRSRQLSALAEEVRSGAYRPFGGEKTSPLEFSVPHPDLHWSQICTAPGQDLRTLWEPARMEWAYTLVGDWLLEENPADRDCFWSCLARFEERNPVNRGENWSSAQECAVRLIHTAVCGGVFLSDKSDANLTAHRYMLTSFIFRNAERIPPTMDYARSQQNNHLLSEAAGLMTAGIVLPETASSSLWFQLGWDEFQKTLSRQIDADGCYIQQSANYQRLMLELVLWVDSLLAEKQMRWPDELAQKIRSSILWLAGLTDRGSGLCRNFGHNDGTNLFPTGSLFLDYRPCLNALSRVFLQEPLWPEGEWDELGAWFPMHTECSGEAADSRGKTCRLEFPEWDSHIWLRAASFHARPAHDDQLQADVFLRGKNIALDAGTYAYNAPAPWDNGLKTAFVHNSVTVDYCEPMTDAGQFLWLDWDQGRILENNENEISAERFAYRKSGIRHQRTIRKSEKGWSILDELTPLTNKETSVHIFRLHWLLLDGTYRLIQNADACRLDFEDFRLEIRQGGMKEARSAVRIVRAGKLMDSRGAFVQAGQEECLLPLLGWISPVYQEKIAALSVTLQLYSSAPTWFETRIILGDRKI